MIEEYTRPARLFENGEIIIKKPLSEIELISFDQIEDLVLKALDDPSCHGNPVALNQNNMRTLFEEALVG